MGKMSREKGKRGERMFASACRDEGFNVHRTQQYCGNTGESADVVGLPHIHVEVKFVERLNIYDAMEQSIRDAKDEMPIVAHKKSRFPWLVTMPLDVFFKLYKESSYAERSDKQGDIQEAQEVQP